MIGALAGSLSGFLGVGGGIIMVPAFTNWVGLPLKRAIATSLVCVGLLCIPGMITHQLLGDIDWLFALPLMVTAIPGARVGAQLAIRASERATAHHGRQRARDDRGRVRGGRARRPRQLISARARAKTASSIGSVSLPVNVFC